ncbi:MAG: Mrp/NBP35 family ATP-binding protein [Eggerthellaceae bacterium]
MTDCSHDCGSCGSAGDCAEYEEPSNARANVKHVYGILSGKGGVGKSLVTGLLACALQRRGLKVAILDADITGPCIPRQFGLNPPLTADADGINPKITNTGIKVMSINLMLPEDDLPVAWRGPVINSAIKQFWGEVNWEDVDVLLVDMPPGTSDVAFTVLREMPVEGIVTVSAPQEMVGMIVGKAVNFTKDFDIPVLGLVENMAYFVCDDCNKKHYIYGQPQGQAVAKKYGIGAYTTLPMDPRIAMACDKGEIEYVDMGHMLDPILDQLNVD